MAWARAVKRRRRAGAPVLWLFTDATRLPDPLAAAAALPRGLAGVVLRQQDAALGAKLARLCRSRRLLLAVAGDAGLAARLHAATHLRNGRWPGLPRRAIFLTASAHDAAGLRRAKRAGAQAIFLSPAFATASHPGARPLGPVRWCRLAAQAQDRVFALGGVNGGNVRRLGRKVAGVGAIAALGLGE